MPASVCASIYIIVRVFTKENDSDIIKSRKYNFGSAAASANACRIFQPGKEYLMRRKITMILCLVLLLCGVIPSMVLSPFAAQADICAGTVYLPKKVSADILAEIDGVQYKSAPASAFPLHLKLTISGLDSDKGQLLLNGKELCYLEEKMAFELNAENLKKGENELIISPYSSAGLTYYKNSIVYGKYNFDDFDIQSCVITDISGNNVPLTLNKYMPIEKKSGTTKQSVPYKGGSLTVGDGWVASTGLGGSTPDVPVYVGMVFSWGDDSDARYFEIDTEKLSDGSHTVKYYDSAKNAYLSETDEITVANAMPEITFPFADGGVLYQGETYTISAADNIAGLVTATIRIDEKNVKTLYKPGEFELDVSNYKTGNHTLTCEVKDKTGRSSLLYRFIRVAEPRTAAPTVEDNSVKAKEGTVLHGVQLADTFQMFENPTGEYNMTKLRSESEILTDLYCQTKAVGNALPYQAFLVDTEGKTGEAILSLSAETGNGNPYETAVWNWSTESWDLVATTPSGEKTAAIINLDTHSKDSKMRVRVYEHTAFNGSDTVVWFTDPQYYARYPELEPYYESIMNYATDLYKKGEAAYLTFTGDLVDQVGNGASVAETEREFTVTSKMFKILEDADMPHGVVVGNHDTQHLDLNYSYYLKYFPSSRYKDKEWYGGSLQNNTHHFDLTTIGGYDFLFMYIGYGKEADDDTVAWANAVLQHYSQYNAVICTHGYLLPSGDWSSTRAKEMYEKIIVPNKNANLVLCGHEPGVCVQYHTVEGTDRQVLEILHDHQFATTGDGPHMTENGCDEDGDAFMRVMTFTESGQLVMRTISPYYGYEYYYGDYQENYVRDVTLSTDSRTIRTTSFALGFETKEYGDSGARLSACDAFYATDENGKPSALVGKEFRSRMYTVPDSAYPERTDYIYPNVWESHVAPTLLREVDAMKPDPDTMVIGKNMLPDTVSRMTKTSGAAQYECKDLEGGGFSLVGISDEYNWVTMSYPVNSDAIRNYPYIFFSITCDEYAVWNLTIGTTEGNKSFGVQMKEEFGYSSFCNFGETNGTWTGYIDLRKYLNENSRITYLYFSSSRPGHRTDVHYLFLGSPKGKAVTCTVDEKTSREFRIKEGGTLAEPKAPSLVGKIFKGWKDENGNAVSFPLKVEKDMSLTAVFEDIPAKQAQVYTNEELELFGFADRPVSVWVWIAIGGGVLLIAAAAAVLILRKKKKA